MSLVEGCYGEMKLHFCTLGCDGPLTPSTDGGDPHASGEVHTTAGAMADSEPEAAQDILVFFKKLILQCKIPLEENWTGRRVMSEPQFEKAWPLSASPAPSLVTPLALW